MRKEVRYIADDEEIFFTEEECLKHEKTMAEYKVTEEIFLRRYQPWRKFAYDRKAKRNSIWNETEFIRELITAYGAEKPEDLEQIDGFMLFIDKHKGTW